MSRLLPPRRPAAPPEPPPLEVVIEPAAEDDPKVRDAVVEALRDLLDRAAAKRARKGGG